MVIPVKGSGAAEFTFMNSRDLYKPGEPTVLCFRCQTFDIEALSRTPKQST